MLKVANVINDTNPCCQHFQLCLGTISNPQTIFLKEETELVFFHFLNYLYSNTEFTLSGSLSTLDAHHT